MKITKQLLKDGFFFNKYEGTNEITVHSPEGLSLLKGKFKIWCSDMFSIDDEVYSIANKVLFKEVGTPYGSEYSKEIVYQLPDDFKVDEKMVKENICLNNYLSDKITFFKDREMTINYKNTINDSNEVNYKSLITTVIRKLTEQYTRFRMKSKIEIEELIDDISVVFNNIIPNVKEFISLIIFDNIHEIVIDPFLSLPSSYGYISNSLPATSYFIVSTDSLLMQTIDFLIDNGK